MKRKEIIELNGTEYTLELNRDSFVQIDRACNYRKSMQIIYRDMYDYYDNAEFDDNFNPELLKISDEEIEKDIELRNETLKKLVERAFFIWLYPNHKLNISQIREILKPYLEDEEKSKWLMTETGKYLQESVEIRQAYTDERKNLKAQINKK